MAAKVDPLLVEILKRYDADPKQALWDCHGTLVILHKHLERIAAKAGIVFDAPQVIEAKSADKIVALCVVGRMGDRSEWSIGEAAPGNNKNSYPYAMAEKRAKDRVILKLVGLAGFIYSEDEADDFKTGPRGEVDVGDRGVEKPKPGVKAEETKPTTPAGTWPYVADAGEVVKMTTGREWFARAKEDLRTLAPAKAMRLWGVNAKVADEIVDSLHPDSAPARAARSHLDECLRLVDEMRAPLMAG